MRGWLLWLTQVWPTEVAVLVEDVAAFLNATISQKTLGGLAGGRDSAGSGLDSDDAVDAYQDVLCLCSIQCSTGSSSPTVADVRSRLRRR